MPVNSHLQWIEVKDFAPGLWTADDWLTPANGWQIMEDCYPTEGGGLRAFFQGTAIPTTGIGAITKERVIGLFARGSIPARSGAPTDLTDYYLCTYLFDAAAGAGSKARPKFYRMDGTNSEVAWTEINRTSGATLWGFATNDSNAPRYTQFLFFQQLAGSPNDQWVIAVVRYVGADVGTFRFNYQDLSSAQKGIKITQLNGTVTATGPAAVHQARLLVAGGTTGGIIYYSNPGDAATSVASGFVQLDPSVALPQIVGLSPSPPSDLFVLRQGAAPLLMQGSIVNQTTQVMGEGINAQREQDVIRTPEGYALIGADGIVYFTNGVTYTPISQQVSISASAPDALGQGSLNYINEFLFAPGGMVYFLPTKSWFTQTQMAGSFHNVERFGGFIWGPVGTGTSFTLAKVSPQPHGGTRVSTWRAKTAPMRAVDGRIIGIREVQVVVKSYDASATFAVTVNGVTNTQTCSVTGRQTMSFLFNQKAEVLDITFVSTAGGSAEAPSIEAYRTGYMPGTNLAPAL